MLYEKYNYFTEYIYYLIWLTINKIRIKLFKFFYCIQFLTQLWQKYKSNWFFIFNSIQIINTPKAQAKLIILEYLYLIKSLSPARNRDRLVESPRGSTETDRVTLHRMAASARAHRLLFSTAFPGVRIPRPCLPLLPPPPGAGIHHCRLRPQLVIERMASGDTQSIPSSTRIALPNGDSVEILAAPGVSDSELRLIIRIHVFFFGSFVLRSSGCFTKS